jgi:hypothetical protein
VEAHHNTRQTLAVHPSDQGMFALAVGEGAADWLSAAARDGPLPRSIARLGRQISFLTSQRLPRPDPTGAIARVAVDRVLDSVASSRRSHGNVTGAAWRRISVHERPLFRKGNFSRPGDRPDTPSPIALG